MSIAPQPIEHASCSGGGWKFTPPLSNGNFELNLSGMTLQLDLLHEGQLINFLDVLSKEMKGRFLLDHCSIDRSGTVTDTNPVAQLKAECAGGWLTLKNRNAQP